MAKIVQVGYKLLVPDDCLVHLVFHVSQLNGALGATGAPQPILSNQSEDLGREIEPKDVKETRTTPHCTEAHVKWVNLPYFEATWELAVEINQRFLQLHLEHKVSVLF